MKKILPFLLCLTSAWATTAVRVDRETFASTGIGSYPPVLAVPGVTIKLYTDLAGTILATTYTDATAGTACATSAQVVLAGTNVCTATGDSLGNFGFWVQSGTYYYKVTLPHGGATYGPYPITAGGSGGGAWGSITGTLSDQSDLASALGGKEPALGNPGSSGYVLSSTTGGTRSWISVSSSSGTVTHSTGALTATYLTQGNGAADIAVSPAFIDGSNVLQNPGGFGTSGASATGFFTLGGLSSGVTTYTVPNAAYAGTITLPQTPTYSHRAFGYTFNGAGAALTSGQTGYLTVPFSCTISAWNMSVDTGTATVDIWKIASGTGLPTISNTITASATPAIASNNSLHSTTLTGWTTAVAANDIVGVNLKATASATVVNLTVECDQ